jgi:hypothetical protein
MKAKRMIEQEIEVAAVRIEVAVRYEEEDIPNDFPLRKGDMWIGTVEIDTGKVREWPVGKAGNLAMKVTDCGTYTLLAPDESEIAKLENDYCPVGLVPEGGDYIDLQINEQGIVTNWPKRPDLSAFFNRDND